jgi:4-amino-4-deoxy-L-arabinose transferase-like glycosyltransferase
MKKGTFLFLGIILLAIFLRFYQLNDVPSSLFRDEVSIGYNAFSILTTGKDEHGIFLPLSLQAIGDQKLPVYIYSTIPFVKIFGTKDFVPRLPAALAGVLIVFLTYFLTDILFKNKKLALLSAFFMAISPWGIFSSRIAYEPTLSLLFITFAVVMYFNSNKHNFYIYLSFISFGLSLLTYHGSQIFTPFFVIGLLLMTKSRWIKNKRVFLIGLGIFLAIGVLAFAVTVKGSTAKISGIGIFSNKSIQYYKIDRRRNEHFNNNLMVKILYNKFTILPFVVGENYLSAFSPQFIFDKGDQNPWQNMEDMGYFYLIDAPFIIIGILLLARRKEKYLKIILLWLLVSPIPGSITNDAPGASRTLNILVPIILVSSYGVYSVFRYLLDIRRKNLGIVSVALICGLYLISFIYFLDFYFVLFPINRAIFFGYGYKQEVMIAKNSSAKKVVISGLHDYTYPYFLYYLSYSADLFRKQVKHASLTSDNFLPVKSFDKYNFVDSIDWKDICKTENVLVVDNYSDFPRIIKPDGIIFLPDKSPRFGYITTNSAKCKFFEKSTKSTL